MNTLYDLLGALADDDADDLRAAFRKAAKACHPDIYPDDPDAALIFRQIVRANAILGDPQQRAAYDRLLARRVRKPDPKPKSAFRTIRKFALDAIAVGSLSTLSIGGYLLFDQLSKASTVAPKASEISAHAPAGNAAVAPAPPFDTAARDGPPDKPDSAAAARDEPPDKPDGATAARNASPDKPDGAAAANQALVPGAVVPEASAGSTQANADAGPAPAPAAKDARSCWERGISAYRDGDLSRAIAEFDQAIRLDPNFADAYVDRGIAHYRLQEFDLAFADISRVKRIKASNPARAAVPATASASPSSARN
jgi:curved DNA-binding protein CbpA